MYDSDNDNQIVNNIHIQNKDSSTKSSNDEILPNSSTIDKNESNNITEIPQQESVEIRFFVFLGLRIFTRIYCI